MEEEGGDKMRVCLRKEKVRIKCHFGLEVVNAGHIKQLPSFEKGHPPIKKSKKLLYDQQKHD
jgi:hypothetical protein